MKAYLVQSEDGPHVVEAETFGEAVSLWRAAMIAEYGGPESGWDDQSEPEQVSVLADSPVIRKREEASGK